MHKGDWRWIGVSGAGGGCLFWCAMGAGRSFVIHAGMSMRILGAVRRIIRRGGRRLLCGRALMGALSGGCERGEVRGDVVGRDGGGVGDILCRVVKGK